MGVLESDLPQLPYKFVKWQCMAPGCTSSVRVKDYGINPFYFWAIRIHHDEKKHFWRGGWFDASGHWRLCSRHWDDFTLKRSLLSHRPNAQILLSKIIKPTK